MRYGDIITLIANVMWVLCDLGFQIQHISNHINKSSLGPLINFKSVKWSWTKMFKNCWSSIYLDSKPMQGTSKGFHFSRETPLFSLYLGREKLPLPISGWISSTVNLFCTPKCSFSGQCFSNISKHENHLESLLKLNL